MYYGLNKLELVKGFKPDETFEIVKTDDFKEELYTNHIIQWTTVIEKDPKIQISAIYDLSAILYCLANIKNLAHEKKPLPSSENYSKMPINFKIQNPEKPYSNNEYITDYFEFNDVLVNKTFNGIKGITPPQPGGPSPPQEKANPQSRQEATASNQAAEKPESATQTKGGSIKNLRNPMRNPVFKHLTGGNLLNPNSKRDLMKFVKSAFKNDSSLIQKVMNYANAKKIKL